MGTPYGTYVYCLVRGRVALDGAASPGGLPHAGPPRLVDAGEGLSVVVCDAPLDRYSSDSIGRGLRDLRWVSECALAHEAVIEHFLGAGDILPLRLFTLFRDDDRVLEHIRGRRADVDRALDRVAGCHEWGLRVRARSTDDGPRRSGSETERAPPASGREFLLRKLETLDRSRGRLEQEREFAERVCRNLEARAAEAVRREPSSAEGRILLEAAFLVPTRSSAEFCGIVDRESSAAAEEGCDVELTGPWPAFHFVGDGTVEA